MDKLESLYRRLPTPVQHLACSLQGYRIERARYDDAFERTLRAVEGRGRWSEEQLCEFRDERVRAFVRHAWETVPFYRRQFEDLSLRPEDIRGARDLRWLPLLDKDTVRHHQPELLSTDPSLGPLVAAHTSGTTGGGLRFTTTRAAEQEQWAVWWRYRRAHGLDRGTWCAYFGGRSVVPRETRSGPFWRYNYAARQILFSAYHVNERNLPAYVDELRRRRPPWFHGYPSLLALLAAYLVGRGEDLGYQPRWITIGAENLLPQQAALIERALGVRPRQHYGMAEAVANISECEHGRLHVDEDFAAVEFIPQAGGACRIVGTNLSNLAMPLIRYEVQDLATLSGENCSCGRPGRIVANVDGRAEDYVILRDGSKVGRLDHIFKDMVTIREAQIHQTEPGAILIRVAPGPGYRPEDEAELIRQTVQRLGADMEVRVAYVDRVERTASGKLRFVVSEVAEGRLTAAAGFGEAA